MSLFTWYHRARRCHKFLHNNHGFGSRLDKVKLRCDFVEVRTDQPLHYQIGPAAKTALFNRSPDIQLMLMSTSVWGSGPDRYPEKKNDTLRAKQLMFYDGPASAYRQRAPRDSNLRPFPDRYPYDTKPIPRWAQTTPLEPGGRFCCYPCSSKLGAPPPGPIPGKEKRYPEKLG